MARPALSALLYVMFGAGVVLGQTTAFTYQGQLTDAGQAANGTFDMQFGLFGNSSGGTQIGTTQTVATVSVSSGVFTVQIDFGLSAFPGANRFLEIGVRPAGAGSYTTLAPRQQISSTPYAIRTLSAATADALSSACVGCVQDTQILSVAGSKVSGAIPAASVPAGSGSYVQNTTTQQANSNFNISGNGTVGGNLTVNGTLNANVSGNFVQNRTTQQANTNFDISGNGTLGGTLSASAVGVGTTAPQSVLDVKGTGWFDGDSTPLPAGAGKGVGVGFLNSTAAGYVFAYDYGTGTPHNLLLNIPGGNVGIGTLSPATKLEVDAASGDGIHGISAFATGVSGESGLGDGVDGIGNCLGAGVSGTNICLSSGVGTQGTSTNGIGTLGTSTNGSGVYGQSAATGNLAIAGVYGKSTGSNGIGVTGEANIDAAVGVYGVSTSASAVGVYGRNNSGGFAMEADGNVQQSRDKGGWVKAMVAVNADGTIARCYNSQINSSNAACGSVTSCCGIDIPLHVDTGEYYVDFHFQVYDRFWSVTTGGSPILLENLTGADVVPEGNSQLIVITFYTRQDFGETDEPFVLIVY